MHPHTQRDRNLFDVVERNVPHLALNVRDESTVQARFKCQRFLRPAQLTALLDDVQREQLSR